MLHVHCLLAIHAPCLMPHTINTLHTFSFQSFFTTKCTHNRFNAHRFLAFRFSLAPVIFVSVSVTFLPKHTASHVTRQQCWRTQATASQISYENVCEWLMTTHAGVTGGDRFLHSWNLLGVTVRNEQTVHLARDRDSDRNQVSIRIQIIHSSLSLFTVRNMCPRDNEMLQLTVLLGKENRFKGWKETHSDSNFQLTNSLIITQLQTVPKFYAFC